MERKAIHRVGIGTDLHRLVKDRQLILGHVQIEFELGLAGHSDADVLLHAVTDALLGAAGLPDIGELFPDTDPRYKDVDSAILLAAALREVAGRGYAIVNVDVTVHAERPKLRPHKAAIRGELAALLGLPVDAVNVKAKTNEGVDAVGRGEAIACTAVVGLTAGD
jgi:2-C-methyl-D-erythritol 2,4-cyclodiphosphate synthase